MMTLAHYEYPDISIFSLCALVGVGRSEGAERDEQIDPSPEDSAFHADVE
jgi:hypothetical protein